MDKQASITWKMRGILLDWLIQLRSKFRLNQETFLTAINLLDRFLSRRTVSVEKFHLLGMVCLHIATKLEEIWYAPIKSYIQASDAAVTREDMVAAEIYVLKVLDYDLRSSSSLSWIRRGNKADGYDATSRQIAKYLFDVSLMDERLAVVVPSLVAAAALWLGRKATDKTEWVFNFKIPWPF